MAYDVEDKVVQLKFDNSEFEPNVEASIKTLSKLENALQYSNGYKGLENADKAVKEFNNDISLITTTLDKVGSGFSAMGVAAVTVISDITRRIENMGLSTLNQLLIAPIRGGFVTYGDQIQSTQVIMNNTGETIEKVKDKLGDLNDYANRTIYNFSQMTYAVGKFAAAGVNLDDATEAIKGLSNAAAMVGANNAQLYSAYYNLSQSMQMGYLKLIDWKSIANSMIGTKQMRREFVKSAIEMGKFTEDSEIAQEAFNNFEDSLRKKWLTTDVIVRTMQKYNDETSDVGKNAIAAASELKSFSQMMDVVMQTTRSSWAETWTTIIGDLAGSKTVWTNIGNRINAIMNAINDTRNAFFKAWNKDGRGTQELLTSICNSLDNLRVILDAVYSVSTKVFNFSADKLYKVTVEIKELTESFKLSESATYGFAKALYQILKPFQLILSTISVIVSVLISFVKIIAYSIQAIFIAISVLDQLPDVLSAIFGDGYENKILVVANIFNNIRKILGTILELIVQVTLATLPAIAPLLSAIGTLLLNVLYIIGTIIESIANSDLEWLSNILAAITTIIHALATVLSIIPKLLSKLLGGKTGESISKIFTVLSRLAVILSRIIELVVTFISDTVPIIEPILENIALILVSISEVIFAFLNGILSIDFSGVTKLFSGVSNVFAIILTVLSKAANGIINILSHIVGFISGIVGHLGNFGDNISDSISSKIEDGTERAGQAINDLTKQGEDFANNIGESIENGTDKASEKIEEFTNSINKSINSNLENNKDSGAAIVKSISNSIDSQLPAIKNIANKININIADELKNNSNSSAIQKSLYANINKSIKKTKISPVSSIALSKITPVIDSNKAVKVYATTADTVINSFSKVPQKLNEVENNIVTFSYNASKPVRDFGMDVNNTINGINEEFDKLSNNINTNGVDIANAVADSMDKILTALTGHNKELAAFIATIMGVPAAIFLTIFVISELLRSIGHLRKSYDDFSKGIASLPENISKITDFNFNIKSTKEVKDNTKKVESFTTQFLKMAAGISLMIAATALIFNQLKDYKLIDENGTWNKGEIAKLSIVFGSIVAVTSVLISGMVALGAIANKSASSISNSELSFNKLKDNLHGSYAHITELFGGKSGPGAIGEWNFSAILPKLKNTTQNSGIQQMAKLIKSFATLIIGVFASISLTLVLTKGYDLEDLKTRMIAMGIALGAVLGAIIAITAIIVANAKNLNGKYTADAIQKLGKAIKDMVKPISTLMFFITKVGGKTEMNWQAVGGMLAITSFITAITGILLSFITKWQKDGSQTETIDKYAVSMQKMANAVVRILGGMALVVLSFSFIKNTTMNWGSVAAFGISIGSVTAMLTTLLAFISKWSKNGITPASIDKYAKSMQKMAIPIDMIMGGLVTIILSMKALDHLYIKSATIGTLAAVSGFVTALSSTIIFISSKYGDKIDLQKILTTLTALGGSVLAISTLMISIKLLNNIILDESVTYTLYTLSAIVAGLTMVIFAISNSNINIAGVASSIFALGGATTAIVSLAISLSALNNVNVSWKTVAQLSIVAGLVAGLGFAAKGIGSGGGHVMIGVAAIIALTVAIIGCAEAVNLLSDANFDTLSDGIKSITNAIDEQGFKKMAEFIGFLWQLGFALMIAAPGIAIAGLSIAGAAYVISLAFKNLQEPLEFIKQEITAFAEDMKNTSNEANSFLGSLLKNKDAISDISKSLVTLAIGFVYLGAGMGVTSVGLWLINKRVLGFVAMLFAMSLAVDIVAFGIAKISENIEGFKNVLDTLKEHIYDIMTLIGTFGANGLGGMFWGIGFYEASKGLFTIAKSLKMFGQGILWVVGGITAAIVVFKLLDQWLEGSLSEKLSNFFNKLKEIATSEGFITKLVIAFVAINAAMVILGLTTKKLGKGLKQLGVGLILTSSGLFLLSNALSIFNDFNGWKVTSNLAAVALGLMTFNFLLSLIAPTIAIVTPTLAPLAGGLALLGNALKVFDTSGNYSTLGIQLITLSIGLLALAGSVYVLNMVSDALTNVTYLLTATAMKSEKWIPLSTSIQTMLINIGNGILVFCQSIGNGILIIGMVIQTTSEMIETSASNIGLAIDDIASGLESASYRIVTASENIATAIDNIVSAVGRARNTLFNGGLSGAISGIFTNGSDKNTKSQNSKWVGIGSWIPKSIATGIRISKAEAINATHELDEAVEETCRDDNGIHSLSELWASIGEWIPKSIGVGITRGEDGAIESVEILDSGIAAIIDKFTNGELKNATNKIGTAISGIANKIKAFKEGGVEALLGGKNGLLGALGIDTDVFGDMFEGLADQLKLDTSAIDQYSSAVESASSSTESAKGTIESLTDTIKNQMKIFDRFTYDEEIMNPKELINNMKSQLIGIQNWANGIDMLAVRGMSGPLLQYLSEMGPEGYKYVEAFLEMTESEFAEANELYAQSLNLPESAANQIGDSYRRVGLDIVESIKSGGAGIKAAASETAQETVDEVHRVSIAGTNTTLEEIDKLAKDNGPLAMAHYCNEAGKWMDSEEFNAFAASVQGKISGALHLPISELIRKSGMKQVMAGQMDSMTYELMKRDYGNETGSFYIDGMTKALSAQEYLDECNKRGEIIAAYINTGINPDYTGKQSGEKIVTSLTDEIKSKESIEKVDNAINNGIYVPVEERLEKLIGRGNEQAKNFVLGFAEGISDKEANGVVLENLQNASDCWNKFLKEDQLKEKSPSELTKEYGVNYILGFVGGVTNSVNLVKDSMSEVGDTAINSLSSTIQAISSQFTEDLDTTPTIRPVLDLTDVYAGAQGIDALFSTQQATIAAQAYSIPKRDTVKDMTDSIEAQNAKQMQQLADIMMTSDQPVNITVTLNGGAEQFFDYVVDRNRQEVLTNGNSPLMIARRNSINAGLA